MAAAVLAADALPDELRALVAARPRAIRSTSRSWSSRWRRAARSGGSTAALALARPLGEIAIPGTIQDVIAARIDRLAEAPKRTLQLAVGDRARVHATPGGPPRRDPGADRRRSCAS